MEAFGGLFWILIIIAIIVFAVWRKHHTRPKHEYHGGRRHACYRMIEDVAALLGYAARELVDREELEAQVEAGATPSEIVGHVCQRIEAAPGLVLGYHQLGEDVPHLPVKLLPKRRGRHLYCIGKTGTGKSTFFARLLLQDARSGEGAVALVPEPEFYREKVLPRLPSERKDDVIFVDPVDMGRPVAYNPLELHPEEDIDRRADGLLQVFREALQARGPRMVPLLQHSLYGLLEQKGTTLRDMYRLLSAKDTELRNRVIQTTRNPQVRRFFTDQFPQFPRRAVLPITNRLDRLLSSTPLRSFLCQPHSGFHFRAAMDEGKLLLFNLSDGLLGAANSHLIGQLLVAQLQQALLSRADIPSHRRTPVSVYLDEFQHYATGNARSYERLLARARKYKARMHLAHQQTGQIGKGILREILGNVGTLVSFQLGRQDAKRLAPEFINQDLYGRTETPKPERLMTLPVGTAYCRIGQNAFPMHTFPDGTAPDPERRDAIIAASRSNYGAAPPPSSGSPSEPPPTEPTNFRE